jgi:hypothetical protein
MDRIPTTDKVLAVAKPTMAVDVVEVDKENFEGSAAISS